MKPQRRVERGEKGRRTSQNCKKACQRCARAAYEQPYRSAGIHKCQLFTRSALTKRLLYAQAENYKFICEPHLSTSRLQLWPSSFASSCCRRAQTWCLPLTAPRPACLYAPTPHEPCDQSHIAGSKYLSRVQILLSTLQKEFLPHRTRENYPRGMLQFHHIREECKGVWRTYMKYCMPACTEWWSRSMSGGPSMAPPPGPFVKTPRAFWDLRLLMLLSICKVRVLLSDPSSLSFLPAEALQSLFISDHISNASQCPNADCAYRHLY